MYRKITVLIGALVGLSFGLSIGSSIWEHLGFHETLFMNVYFNAIIFALFFVIISWIITPFIEKMIKNIQIQVNKQTPATIIFGTIGTIIGLMIGYLIALPFNSLEIPFISTTLPLVFSITLAVLGYQTAIARKEEWSAIFSRYQKERHIQQGQLLERKVGDNFYKHKLLDTSVIIDGRILAVAEAGFVEGALVIPNFVLHELQLIADSSDAIKRSKGRRGLDMLNTLQKNTTIPIETYEGDFEDISEVDSKLMKLAKMMDAAIVTNDYNMAKVCEFQNIKVLNLNTLTKAVQPTIMAGEELEVMVIKAGTERKQGVAYLEDGTMIVVEDGQHYMNEWVKVIVTSALQTAAGRMIFAKPAHSQYKLENKEEE